MNQLHFGLLLLSILGACTCKFDGPVIGMFMQESSNSAYPGELYDWVDSSHVYQWASQGAMIIPLFQNYTYEQMDILLEQVNGVHFPGGGADLWVDVPSKTGMSETTLKAQHILKRANEFN